MLIAKRIYGCQAYENLRRAEGNEGSAEAEPYQALKDERSGAHAEEFSEGRKARDLPSVCRIEGRSDTRH